MLTWARRWLHSKERPIVMVADPPFNAEPQSQDLVAELRRWGSVDVGTPIIPANAWGPLLTKLLNDAANKIERQQSTIDRVTKVVDATSRDPERSEFHRGWNGCCEFVTAALRYGQKQAPPISTPALCGTGNPEAGDYAGVIDEVQKNG